MSPAIESTVKFSFHSLSFSRTLQLGTLLWTSGHEPMSTLLTITLVGVFDHPPMHLSIFCHLVRAELKKGQVKQAKRCFSGNFIQLLPGSHTSLPGHLRDVILFLSLSSGSPSSQPYLLCVQRETPEQHPCQVQLAPLSVQLTGPLGFLRVSPSYRDCASSLQSNITLTARVFVLILFQSLVSVSEV